jgi:hypothetical protein
VEYVPLTVPKFHWICASCAELVGVAVVVADAPAMVIVGVSTITPVGRGCTFAAGAALREQGTGDREQTRTAIKKAPTNVPRALSQWPLRAFEFPISDF